MKSIVVVLFAVISIFISTPVQADAQYSLMDLGTLGGTQSYATGINNSGQIVGCSFINGNVNEHAFRTAVNKPINPATDDLGTLGGVESWAKDINNSGQVVGWAFTKDTLLYAFRAAPNRPLNPAADSLGTLGGINCYGRDINDIGQVVGYASLSDNVTNHAFRTAANKPINPTTDDLGTLGGRNSNALGINNSGQVVGAADNGTYDIYGFPHEHAYRTVANKRINPATDDLGTLGGTDSEALGINESGQVIGESSTGGFGSDGSAISYAFRTAPNQPINPATDNLGTLVGNSYAWDINNSGQVVGFSYTDTNNRFTHAFLFSGTGPMQDLNNMIDPGSGWMLASAEGINDLGQIVGSGTINGQIHAFLLTPVPEPSTILLLGIGAVSLLAFVWRKRQSK